MGLVSYIADLRSYDDEEFDLYYGKLEEYAVTQVRSIGGSKRFVLYLDDTIHNPETVIGLPAGVLHPGSYKS